MNYLDQLEVIGDHFEIFRQVVVWPTMTMSFTEMLCATAAFTPPQFLGDIPKPHVIYFGNLYDAAKPLFQVIHFHQLSNQITPIIVFTN
jgi:hypothetical protein